jgi:hypothetical protein
MSRYAVVVVEAKVEQREDLGYVSRAVEEERRSRNKGKNLEKGLESREKQSSKCKQRD